MSNRIPLPRQSAARTKPYLPDPSEYMDGSFQPADLSSLIWNTPDDPSCAVSRACQRIDAAIDANPECTTGLFSRTVCVGTPKGLHDEPTLVALIDADPHSVIDHWYGLVGYWHGRAAGLTAGIIRLPMIDAPDIDTLIKRIRQAWAECIQRARPDRRRSGDPCDATQRLCGVEARPGLGSKLQFLQLLDWRRDAVFCRCNTFDQAVDSLEDMIGRHDRELRRAPMVWWTDRHPGDRLLDRLCQARPRIRTPHVWPTLPWEWPYTYKDADVSSPQEAHPLIDVLAACPDRERSVFTQPRVRNANRRTTCPEVFVFAGRRRQGRNWIYGRIQVRDRRSFAGLVPMPAFLDGDRNLDLFDILRKDCEEPFKTGPREDPPEETCRTLEAKLASSLSEYFGGKPAQDIPAKTGTGALP